MTQTAWPNPAPPAAWGDPPPPPPPGAGKKPWVGKLLLAVAGLIALGAIVSSNTGDTSSPASSTALSGSSALAAGHTVTYKVEGTTNMASITYSNAYGDTSQQSDIDVPLRRQDTATWSRPDGGHGIVLEGMRRGDFLYISAQNSQEYGSVTCMIEVDGVVVKRNTSHGGYTIATCSGRL